MKITEIRETTAPIGSAIRNAYIDFSVMTCSVVALVTDVVRDGRPVIGYGFNSNGRYAQGPLLREGFIPRVLSAEPDSLVNDDGSNLDPHRISVRLVLAALDTARRSPDGVERRRGSRSRRQRVLSERVSAVRWVRRRHPVEDGYVSLPELPGIGFEAKRDLYRVMEPLGRG